jgi:IPT/TIG domain
MSTSRLFSVVLRTGAAGLVALIGTAVVTAAVPSPTFVQQNYATPQTPSTTVTVPFKTAQTAGNLNVVIVGWNDATRTVQSVTDTKGNAYVRAVGPTVLSGRLTQSIYYAKSIASAAANANTVTVTFSGAAIYPDIRIAEYSGVDQVNPLDVAAGASGTTGASDSGPVTTTAANALLVAGNVVQSQTSAAGAGFTSRVVTQPDSDILEDRVVTSVGTYRGTAPITGGGWVMQVVAFRAANGAATAPTITSVVPTGGPVGTPVTITGTNFGGLQGNSTVTFNGTAASPTFWSATSIGVPVPAGATTGNVVVTVGGLASNGQTFTVTAAPPPVPTITSLAPTSGPVATAVTITGTNFGGSQSGSTVTFNGTPANPTSWSPTSISVPVPAGATTGNVVVTVGGLASNGRSFTITAAPPTPTITSLAPTSGAVGTAVTITGTNFGGSQGNSTVTFNGTAASPTSWSATSIGVPVPAGATTGDVIVTVGGLASNGQNFTVTAAPPGTATPTLVQHVASSANPVGLGISGNAFKIPLPNAVGAGNCLILGLSYPSGKTITITDNNGNSWPSTAAVTANTSGTYVASIFVLPNARSGATTLTVSFNGSVIPFQYTISEFNNVATANPVSGISQVGRQPGPSLSTGTFTPANNDANGGNLIWSYFAVASGANANPTRFVPGSNFVLLDADIAWNTRQGFPHASEYSVQTTSAAINPAMTATGDSSNVFNGVSVALRAAAAGTPAPSGIRILRVLHMTSNVPPAGSTWPLQVPSSGNLIALVTNRHSIINLSSVTDSKSNVYTIAEPDASEPQVWFAGSAVSGSDLMVTLHIANTPATVTVVAYDITGAASSPLDVVAGKPATDVSGVSSITNAPSITPTTENGLVIASVGIGQGPGLSVTSPAGATWDLVTYAGELDTDLMENADAKAHFYYSTTATQNWNWTLTANPNNTYAAVAVAFKAAAGGAQAPSITGVSPTSGPVSTPVMIAGSNFGGSQGSSTVMFNGMAANPTSWSATSIGVTVPAGATTGNIAVTVGGVASNSQTFTVTAPPLPPTITSLTPASGPVGTAVTIAGSNFGTSQGTSAVTFNGTATTPSSWSPTGIGVTVPAGATTGSVVVIVGGVASNGQNFTVTTPPTITSLSPTSGPVGTAVTIAGSNFGTSQGASTVTFNGTAATPTSWSATSIDVTVPAGATTGSVVVTVGGSASNGRTFTVSGAATATPTLVQQLLVQSNQNFESGNSFINALPNPVLDGNCLIVAVTYARKTGRTVAISDNIGTNNWTLLAGPFNDSSGNFTSAIYASFNTQAGTQRITVTFDGPLFDFQAVISEWYNVATASALDGIAAASVSAPTVAAGTITTTQSGDLIYQYGIDTGWGVAMEGNSFTGYTAGTGFTLLAADRRIAVVHQYAIQPTAGSVNPTFKTTGGGADSFATLAVALKAASAGTAPDPRAMRIVSTYHTRVNAGSPKINFPTVGNLLVITTAYHEGQEKLQGVTDSNENQWAVVTGSSDPQMAYAKNVTPGSTLVLTLNVLERGSGNMQLLLYDVVNADPNPYVKTAYASGSAGTGNPVVANAPTMTPQYANGLVLTSLNLYTGPPGSMTSPAGVVFDSIYYTGATDLTPQDSGDGYGHYYPTSTAPVSFNWKLSNGSHSTGWSAAAWEFKAAAGAAGQSMTMVAASAPAAPASMSDTRQVAAPAGVVATVAATPSATAATAAGGRITGVVTDALTGAALANVSVAIYDSNGVFVAGTSTNTAGQYLASVLADGTYYARTYNPAGYFNQRYADGACLGCDVTAGTPIVVSAGRTRSGKNFTLAPGGGTVGGRVTDAATGAPVGNARVDLYDANGRYVTSAYTKAWAPDLGTYVVQDGLPSGTYYAEASATTGYLREVYGGSVCTACATTTGAGIAIVAGTPSPNVDFTLARGGSIAGIVTDAASGHGIPNVVVAIFDAHGQLVTTTNTDASGAYVTQDGLVSGTYFVRTFNHTGYVDNVHAGQSCASCGATGGTSVAVTVGSTTADVNFALVAGGL